jgi:hypothetical protein
MATAMHALRDLQFIQLTLRVVQNIAHLGMNEASLVSDLLVVFGWHGSTLLWLSQYWAF